MPKERPASWLSAAFHEDSDHPDANLCSAGYQVHAYRNPVLFTDAAKAVPNGALLLEIGPHSILRAPLRQSRPDLGYVSLMKKGTDGVSTVSSAVGDLWRSGVAVHWSTKDVPSNATGTEGKLSFISSLNHVGTGLDVSCNCSCIACS